MKLRSRIALGVASIPVALACLAMLALWDPFESLGVAMPRPRNVEVARLGGAGWTQGWTVEHAREFHHTSQGTKILPVAWFRALEPPTFNPLRADERLASREYLSRFGFLYDPEDPKSRTSPIPPLPIGMAVEDSFVAPYLNPPVKVKTKVVGLTCAACHTGRLDVEVGKGRTVGVLIEGGSAMIDLGKFQEAVGKSLGYTSIENSRFQRFANRVLADEDCPPDEKIPGAPQADNIEILRKHLKAYVQTGIAGQDYAKEHKLYPVEGGFSRTDALTLIGNRVFGLSNVDNQTVTDAPVNFPHLWDTAWFDWVQYNASIRMPMARNIGEALGVGAAVKPSDSLAERYETTVRIDNLDWMEDLLGGDTPLAVEGKGSEMLQPPRWDDFREAVKRQGKLEDNDEVLRRLNLGGSPESGKHLYVTHCQNCHLPPREVLRGELAVEDSPYWEKDERSGKKFLKLKVFDLSVIGTDQNQAVTFYRRFAVVPNPLNARPVGNGSARPTDARYPLTGASQTISAKEGLYRVTSLLRLKYYEENRFFLPSNEDLRRRFDRYRTLPIAKGKEELLETADAIVFGESMDDVIRANLGYKARPLDGIWATPPYFHNGSVPNLYQVLGPAERRAQKFYLGRTLYDPLKVGYLTNQFPGGFLMNTLLPGNSNGGHEFRNYSLEEFENALALRPAKGEANEERWKVVFLESGAGSPGTDSERKQAARRLTDRLLNEVREGVRHRIKNLKFSGVRGVIGSELTEEEKWDLIAYLKTL